MLVIMPVRTFQRRLSGSDDINQIQLSVRESISTEKAQQDLSRFMRERRRLADGDNDDFSIMDQKELASTLSGTTRTLTALLAAIAAVSLLVGGIGIMNIMLVTVTERTREIGIRLAIGALERDVADPVPRRSRRPVCVWRRHRRQLCAGRVVAGRPGAGVAVGNPA